jgi:ribosomal protein S18 acetylase RimI-like enzyme
MRSPRVYADNASAMWTSLAPAAPASAGFVRIESPASTRVILREPMPTAAIAELIDATPTVRRTIVEDAFGAGPPQLGGAVQVLRMPVMICSATQVPVVVPPNVQVAAVVEADELAEAERVVVDGFPLPVYQPWTRGQALPPRVLRLPGWRVWLAYRDGLPAAAGYTYDDGVVVGVYWVATLPQHRSLGLARALMTVSMAAYPGRIFTLVATDAGLALYESLGFATVSMSAWYVRPPSTNRQGRVGRP